MSSGPFVITCLGAPRSGKTTLAQNLAASFKIDQLNAKVLSPSAFDPRESNPDGYLFIDGPSQITEDTKKILKHSSAILVSTECEAKLLYETKKILDSVFQVVPKDLVYVVLNHYQPETKIDPLLIKKQLGCNILGAIAKDPAFQKGDAEIALVSSNPKSIGSQYILQLTKIIRSKKILERGQIISRAHLIDREVELKATGTADALPVSSPTKPQIYNRFSQEELPKDPRTQLKMKILKQLTSELDLKKLDTETGSDPKKIALLREKTRQAVLSIIERDKIYIGSKGETEHFIKEILDESLGLGPIEVLLADPTVTEIMVNRKDQIYIEKNGKITLSNLTFTSNSQLLGIIERIVSPLGRRIDEKTPYCDARLPDGSRVHAIIPPLSIQGPMITIRKFSKTPFKFDDLIRLGSITEDMVDFLRAAIQARQNCVVSGGTGTGKTTLLNVLSSFISDNERIITVEDAAELQLTQPHWCRLETRPANIEGSGAITIRDLVRNTLRMRPDRIVVGECRDGAALDMLQAMNTGHDGSLTTVHANNPRDCLSRLETLVMMAGMDLPSRAIREQIASAVNLIVQISRFSDGTRKITHVSEVTGMEKDVITMQDIVIFKQKSVDAQGKVIGVYELTGAVPKFIFELEKKGLRVPKGFFGKRKSDRPEKE